MSSLSDSCGRQSDPIAADNYCGNEENTRVKEDMMQGVPILGIWYTTSKKLLMALDLQPTYHMTS